MKKVVFYALHCLRNLAFFGRLPYLLFHVQEPLRFADVGTCIKIFYGDLFIVFGFWVGLGFFSSPEHEVLMVSYWDSASSVVNFLPCVRSRGHSFGRVLMKVGQDVCLDEILDEIENGSCGVKN